VLSTSSPGETFQFHVHPSVSPTPLLMIQTHMQICMWKLQQYPPTQPTLTHSDIVFNGWKYPTYRAFTLTFLWP
jgi:hypothetical protein